MSIEYDLILHDPTKQSEAVQLLRQSNRIVWDGEWLMSNETSEPCAVQVIPEAYGFHIQIAILPDDVRREFVAWVRAVINQIGARFVDDDGELVDAANVHD